MYSFIGTNPTKLYYDSLMMTLDQGDECAPRGKLIKELRPAAFEFENPYNRITFLGSRRINPYFQFAEALWILSGRSDVPWLCKFNANMNQFSDDGKNFNAPYGERIRSYGKNNLHNFIVNPVDQLLDAYYKLLNDKDTRQAVIVISHPQFDNSRYTIGEHGKDIACLTGDTIIASPEGDILLSELVEKENYPVYSYNEKERMVEIKPVVAGGITRRNASILKITMGDGTVIKATPDHKFYVKKYKTEMHKNENGHLYPVNTFEGYELIQAEDLKIGDRLPFLLRYEEEQGYVNLNISNLSKSMSDTVKEHILYMQYHLGRTLRDGEVVHHKNHKRNQNFIENLEVLDKNYHDSLEMEDNKIQVGLSKARTPKELLTKDNLLKIAKSVIESGKTLTEDTFKKSFVGVGCISACKRHYGTFSELKKLAYSELNMEVPNGLAGSNGDYNSTKIVDIQWVENEDVYDITVADNHNFFANGYLVHNCNLVITFKIRHDKLNMTVFNRSNDISWGTFGANLNQFATIQETMKSWLKKSGKEEFSELEVGTYTQFTDSLHVYLDDYGAADVAKVTDYYKSHDPSEVEADYTCQEEPRMSLNAQEFDAFLQIYWNAIDPYLMDDDYISDEENASELLEMITDFHNSGVIDDYWFFGVKAMLAYRLVKLGFVLRGVQIVEGLVDCQWKISMIYFLKTFVKKVGKDVEKTEEYAKILEYWDSMSESFSESLVHPEYFEQVSKYLEL